jgi:hypothetical protein
MSGPLHGAIAVKFTRASGLRRQMPSSGEVGNSSAAAARPAMHAPKTKNAAIAARPGERDEPRATVCGMVPSAPVAMPVVVDAASRPPDPSCPECDATLVYVETEPSSSGAFRTQAESMPKMAIHFYDCPECGACWKLGTRLMADPVRQILKG